MVVLSWTSHYKKHFVISCEETVNYVFIWLILFGNCQSFLEESRQLMRLPPRQSTAEADLMVPFQLVSLSKLYLGIFCYFNVS